MKQLFTKMLTVGILAISTITISSASKINENEESIIARETGYEPKWELTSDGELRITGVAYTSPDFWIEDS